MYGSHAVTARIVVLAPPTVGRRVDVILRSVGYEVHRTPDDGNLGHLVARLRPRLVIVTLDIRWVNAVEAVHPLLAGTRPVPVLLLGEEQGDPRLDGVPRLPLAVDAALLLTTVRGLLATSDLGD